MHTHTRTHIHTHTHIYRQVKCGCGLIVRMPAIVLAYISVYDTTVYLRSSLNRDESATREKDSFQKKKKQQSKKRRNKRRESILFVSRYVVRPRYSLVTHVFIHHTGNLYTAKQKLENFWSFEFEKQKEREKVPLFPPFFVYLSLYIYPSISNSPFYFSLFLSRSLVPLFLG